MRALTVVPGKAGSAALDDVPEPEPELGTILVEAIGVGICGTDVEIADGGYGWAPPGRERLVLGHESLGRVIDPGPTDLAVGDHVVGIVRRPDPVPCPNCAVGEWDMCSNGRYTERGIKQVDGFMSERWRIEPEYVVRVDNGLGMLGVLLEPTTVVAKAWEQIITIGHRTFWDPTSVLVVGAGPIGLLAALIGVQRGLDVHVLDRVETGPKPALVAQLGATYHTGAVADLGMSPDIVVECTGVVTLVQQAAHQVAPGGIVCLTGVGAPSATPPGSASSLATDAVLRNLVMFGSVNANRRHYYRAAKALATADRSWLDQLVTRRVAPDDLEQALTRGPDDIKVVMDFGASWTATPIVTRWSNDRGWLSEGPRWHAQAQELLWVDILGADVHRGTLGVDGALTSVHTTRLDRHVGAVAPATEGGYVAAAGVGFVHLGEDGSVRELAQPDAGRTDVRMNDGACDARGRFWAGTMAYDESPGAGSLYRLELDGRCTTVLTGLTISNGIGWSPDGSTMYLADSGTGAVDAYDVDGDGEIGRPRRLVTIAEPGVAPDGLTVDDDGAVWVALWGGGAVHRYAPDGALLAVVDLPVERPTSCAFGGRDRSTLFVTTSREGLDEAAMARQPHAGHVFRIDGLGVTGPPCAPFRGRTAPV